MLGIISDSYNLEEFQPQCSHKIVLMKKRVYTAVKAAYHFIIFQ